MNLRKGLVALDIDGTLTVKGQPVPKTVCDFLYQLHKMGQEILFVTGRTFTFAYPLLKDIAFPYYITIQNGAAIVEMPGKNVVFKKYLSKTLIPHLSKIFGEEHQEFLIEGGVEIHDKCYYRSSHCTSAQLEYFAFRQKISGEIWASLNDYHQLDLSEFPLVKCFGSQRTLEPIAKKMTEQFQLQAPIIADPFRENDHILMMTHPEGSKGNAVLHLKKHLASNGPLIVAGDDMNDESMLSVADYRIVMETAPDCLKVGADCIAPSAEKQGIIPGLLAVVGRL